jgi:hypothetical protein
MWRGLVEWAKDQRRRPGFELANPADIQIPCCVDNGAEALAIIRDINRAGLSPKAKTVFDPAAAAAGYRQRQSNDCSRVWAKEERCDMCYRRIWMAVGLMSWALVAAPGFAQDQAIVGIQTQSNYFVEGRIAAVDPTARSVTIVQTDGTPRTLSVSPAAANLVSTKVGDNVALNIDDTRTFVLSGRNTRTP